MFHKPNGENFNNSMKLRHFLTACQLDVTLISQKQPQSLSCGRPQPLLQSQEGRTPLCQLLLRPGVSGREARSPLRAHLWRSGALRLITLSCSQLCIQHHLIAAWHPLTSIRPAPLKRMDYTRLGSQHHSRIPPTTREITVSVLSTAFIYIIISRS